MTWKYVSGEINEGFEVFTWMYSFFSPHSHALFLSSLLQVFGMLVWILVGGTEYFYCSLLGDVCCHFVLGSDHLPVYNVPHWSPQQDTTGPLDYTGKTNTHTHFSFRLSFLHFYQLVWLPCLFICWSSRRCAWTAVLQLCIWCSRFSLSQPGCQGETQLQLLGASAVRALLPNLL